MNTFSSVKETFDELYGRLSLPVVLFDEKARLMRANQSFLDLAKASLDDLKTHSLEFFFKDLKTPFERESILKAAPRYYIIELTDTEGNKMPVRLHYTRLKKEDGAYEGGLGFITDLRHLIEMRAAQEKIKELTLENEVCKEKLGEEKPDKILHEKARLEKDLTETKKFLENVLESCGDGLFSVENTGKIALVNESFASTLGKKKEEIVGTMAYEVGPLMGTFRSTTGETITLDQSYSDYQTNQLEKLQELRDGYGGKIEHWEFYAFNKKREIVPLELTVSIKKNAEGDVTGSVTSARNLTKKRIAEKEIEKSRGFLEKMFEASYDGIVISSINGIISMANSAIEKITGHRKEEFIGKLFSEVVKAEGITEEERRKIEDTLYVKGQISFETSFRNKDGELVHVEHGISLIEDAKGEAPLTVSIVRDITEKKKAAKALQEAYRFRSQFFTNITHAFRTPLTLAIGPLEGILRGEFGNLSKEIKEQLSLALRNSKQLLKLIDQLLDFSRLESGKRTVFFEKKDLRNFISAILDSFSFIAKKKKINLTFTPDSDFPYVSIDPVKVEKVLFDIIGNAFKFTPEKGSIKVTIENGGNGEGKADRDEVVITNNASSAASVKPEGEYVKISIVDTGIGIEKDNLARIFDRFKQGSRGFFQKDGGTGIGLAHAKELVELMGGRITVKSAYGRGSTFSVYLPVKRFKEDEGSEAVEEAKEELLLQPEVELSDIHQEKGGRAESISGKRPLILIIDDNPDVRQYVSSIVKEDYDYMTVGSGEEGLKKLKEKKPDLILCDIMMPEMDGYEFLKQVKSHPQLKDISFIFLTARADTEMKIEGLEEGADDYIVKPFNSLELLARVKSLLRIRSLMERNVEKEKKIEILTQKLQGKYSYGNIVGDSSPMRRIYQLLENIKESESTVLIAGETGTGKELIANAIHYYSSRKDNPMVSVNCGAIPKELMEREFFGHVKGAYTGAVEDRKGYFQEADKGTLFLDEIGAMDRDMQVKLLRVLERGEIIRVGDSAPTKVDVRLIAATNKDLRSEVKKGNFREDLYYRIYVIPLHVPPLRERKEDIPLLITYFLKNLRSKLKKDLPHLSDKDMNLFMNYTYPGNVRELEHIIERFCLLGSDAEDLFDNLQRESDKLSSDFPYDALLLSTNPLKTVAQKAKAHAERNFIKHTLKICDNNYNEAAKMLNVGLSSLYRKLKEYGEPV
jgi:PAS domain S-box-containing protein